VQSLKPDAGSLTEQVQNPHANFPVIVSLTCLKFLFDWLESLTAQSLNPHANFQAIVSVTCLKFLI
jgi:hypothetical protein